MKIVRIVGLLALILMLGLAGFRLINAGRSRDQKLAHCDQSFEKNKSIHQGFVEVYAQDGNLLHRVEKNMTKEDLFQLASITKLYTHAVTYALVDEGQIDLDDRISDLLPEDLWKGINVKDHQDLSDQITIKHCLDQNSGLADYETDSIKGKASVMDRLMKEDFALSPLDAIALTRDLEGKYEPGSSKAYYSNLNAILLGLVIEQKTGLSLEDAMEKYIFSPLKLTETRLIAQDQKVVPLCVGAESLDRVKYTASALAPGGLVSTSQEVFIFLDAFFSGQLFDIKHIENPEFRALQFFPLEYGSGMMKMQLSFLMSPLIDAPEIRGHSGSTGSFAFYCPERQVYIIGTINQVKTQPFQVIFQYLDAFKKYSSES